MEKGLYYLASPFQGTEEEEAYRLKMSLEVSAAFLRQGINVFAPLVYNYEIAKELEVSSLEERREIFMPFLFDFLKVSNGMILLCLEGWKESWGVQQELVFCQKNKIPVYQLNPHQIPSDLSEVFTHPLDAQHLEVA